MLCPFCACLFLFGSCRLRSVLCLLIKFIIRNHQKIHFANPPISSKIYEYKKIIDCIYSIIANQTFQKIRNSITNQNTPNPYFLNKSLICVNNTSSFEGPGAAAGLAASFFLIAFIGFTTNTNIASAIIIKLIAT